MPPTRGCSNVHISYYGRSVTKTVGESATFVRCKLMTGVFAAAVGGRFTFDVKIILVCRWWYLLFNTWELKEVL